MLELPKLYEILDENYLLIITTNSIEKKAVNNIIELQNKLDINIKTYGCSIGLINETFVIHVTGTSGVSDEVSTSRIIMEFISNTTFPNPLLTVMIGFCWGNPNFVKIGDITLCDTIVSLNKKTIDNNKTTYEPKSFTSQLKMNNMEKEINKTFSNIKIGTLGSLETRLQCNITRDEILNQFPQLIGGEMEGFGYIPSLHDIPWLIIKTVSDYGDNAFTREEQERSVESAAEAFPMILSILIKNDFFYSKNFVTVQDATLKSLLLGTKLEITKNKFTSDSLNDYLNDYIYPIIELKLVNYRTCSEYNSDFIEIFSCLILEIIQNSFKHAGATKVSIMFNAKNLIIEDDKIGFDLNNIPGERGGAESWDEFKLEFLDEKLVKYSFIKNKHKFYMPLVDIEIAKIISDCRVSIIPSTIGSGFKNEQILSYNEDCTAVFVDDTQVAMKSRRNDLIDEVRILLQKKLIVYILLNSDRSLKKYKKELSDYVGQFHIIFE